MDVAVLYCRKSNESALPTDVSFDIQQNEGENYAKERGYRVGRILKESHSGADLIGRPLIWEAIEEVKSGRAQVLLVRNYDRLARKMEHQGVILYEVEEKYHGRVEAALDHYDRNDPWSVAMRGIMGAVAEMERMNAVARMERGKRYRAERGELMAASNPKFGYAWADDFVGERTTYIIDSTTGPLVVRIFQLATTGYSLRSIAKLLNAEHVITPSQWSASQDHIGRKRVGTSWLVETVRRVINDPTYMGEGAAYRHQYVKTKNGKRFRTRRTEGSVKLNIPALVDAATWGAANAAVTAKETVGRPPLDREATWLRHHVYYGVCDSRMYVIRDNSQWGEGKYLFRCARRPASGSVGGQPCAGGDFSIRAHMLDPFAYESMTAWVGAYRLGALREKMIARLGLGKMEALVSMSEGFQAQLREKGEELDTTRRRARQTKDDALAAQFIADAEELNRAIAALEADYAEARDALDNFNAGNAWVDATLERIRQGIKDIESPTEEEIRALDCEERRFLLGALGLMFKVFPTGWREDGRRVLVDQYFLVDPITNEPLPGTNKLTQPRYRW